MSQAASRAIGSGRQILLRVFDVMPDRIGYNAKFPENGKFAVIERAGDSTMLEQLGNPWWGFIVVGIFAGILSGSLGLGGGVLLVPALALACGYPQKSAQGMSLAIMAPMVLLGAFRYWRIEAVDVDLTAAAWVIAGALVGVMIGTGIACRLPTEVLRKIFAVVLVIIAVRMFIGPSMSQKAMAEKNLKYQNNVSAVEPGGMSNESGK